MSRNAPYLDNMQRFAEYVERKPLSAAEAAAQQMEEDFATYGCYIVRDGQRIDPQQVFISGGE